MKTNKNRWLIALSTIAIHLSIGAAYAYSVYRIPISESLGWGITEITVAFTLMMALAGLSAAFFGSFVERMGPRKSALVAAVLFGAGQAGAGVAIAMESLQMFILTYGLLSGLGLGIGYIAPVSTLVKWFPDRRGFATGMAVMGFGAGALLTAPIAAKLIMDVGISNTFYILGASYFTIMVLGASYIAPPPEGYLPEGMKEAIASGKKKNVADLSQLTQMEAVKTKRFWMLWAMMLINTSAGIMMISVASPMAQEVVGLTAVAAGTMVGFMGLFNGAGRLGWATISDYIGRRNIYMIFFIIQIVAFSTLSITTHVILFQLLILIVVSCYGGGFSNLPAFIADLFGVKKLGAIHGFLLTTWSLGGILGPLLVSTILERTGSYNPVFYLFIGLMGVALVISVFLKADIKKLEAANQHKQKELQTSG